MEPAIPQHLQHHPVNDKIRVIFSGTLAWHTYQRQLQSTVLDFWQCQLTDDHLPGKSAVTHNVFQQQEIAFKFNVGLSFLLQNQQTQEVRFVHASYNNSDIFEKNLC